MERKVGQKTTPAPEQGVVSDTAPADLYFLSQTKAGEIKEELNPTGEKEEPSRMRRRVRSTEKQETVMLLSQEPAPKTKTSF